VSGHGSGTTQQQGGQRVGVGSGSPGEAVTSPSSATAWASQTALTSDQSSATHGSHSDVANSARPGAVSATSVPDGRPAGGSSVTTAAEGPSRPTQQRAPNQPWAGASAGSRASLSGPPAV